MYGHTQGTQAPRNDLDPSEVTVSQVLILSVELLTPTPTTKEAVHKYHSSLASV